MPVIAAFDVKVLKNETNNKFTLVLQAEGDTFEVECDTPGDLMDEVDELLNEKLVQCGFVVEEV